MYDVNLKEIKGAEEGIYRICCGICQVLPHAANLHFSHSSINPTTTTERSEREKQRAGTTTGKMTPFLQLNFEVLSAWKTQPPGQCQAKRL
jgi:hypothetical protein